MSAKISIKTRIGKKSSIASSMPSIGLRNLKPLSVKNMGGRHSTHDLRRNRLGNIKVAAPCIDGTKLTVAQVIAQARLSDAMKTHRLVMLPRAKAERMTKHNGNLTILGQANQPAEVLCANLLKVTSPSKVEDIEILGGGSYACGSPDGSGFGRHGGGFGRHGGGGGAYYRAHKQAKKASRYTENDLVLALETIIEVVQHNPDVADKVVQTLKEGISSQSPKQEISADEQLLKYLKVEYKSNPTYRCGDMLNLLHEERWQGAKDQARFAWEIYHAKILNPMDGFSTFCAWYKEYCRIMGIEPNPDYKPSKLGENEASRQIRKYLPVPEKEKLFHVG